MVDRVPAVTRQLLSKIPRLEGVIEILDRYRAVPREGDGGSGSVVPVGARVLRIAVDYANLESGGASPTVALGAMRNRDIYDPALLQTFADMVGVGTAPKVREVAVGELRVGMSLAGDVRSWDGVLLVARGQRVSAQLIERLSNMSRGSVHQPLHVFDIEQSR